jgi:hypothetical protein
VNARFVVGPLVALAGVALAGDARNTHPHFDDRGTLVWSSKLSDAQAAAKAAGKLIFVDHGRES